MFLFYVQEAGGFGGSLHTSLPDDGEVESFLLPQNGHMQFLTSSSNAYCGVFLFVGWFLRRFFFPPQVNRSTGCGTKGGILPVSICSFLLTGLRELPFSLFPSFPLPMRAPTLWFHHCLMLDCRELIIDFLFWLAEILCSATCHQC